MYINFSYNVISFVRTLELPFRNQISYLPLFYQDVIAFSQYLEILLDFHDKIIAQWFRYGLKMEQIPNTRVDILCNCLHYLWQLSITFSLNGILVGSIVWMLPCSLTNKHINHDYSTFSTLCVQNVKQLLRVCIKYYQLAIVLIDWIV